MHQCAPRNPCHKASYRASIDRGRAVALMAKIKPLMGSRRQAQIDEAIRAYNPSAARDAKTRLRKLTPEQVVEARRRHRAGESGSALAEEYGMFYTGFYRMLRGNTYADIPD